MKNRREYYQQRYAEQRAMAHASVVAQENNQRSAPPTIVDEILNRPGSQYITARARWRRLPDDKRLTVLKGFVRHTRACRSVGISPDPAWLVESLGLPVSEIESSA